MTLGLLDPIATPASPPGAGPARAASIAPTQVALAVALVGVTAALAVAFPLATYTVTLALFGLPHVVAELRYVDARFSPRAGGRLVAALAALLALVVGLRVAGLLGLAGGARLGALELGVVGVLAACALPALARRGAAPLALGLAVVGALAAGALFGSAAALVTLALLHNLTPVGFLAERLRGRARARALLACGAVFLGLPALIASGLPQDLLGDLVRWDVTPLTSAGSLERSLTAFVPAPLLDSRWALSLFSAAAFLQVMHYAVVLGVLPRLDDDATWARPRSTLPWPRRATFALVVGLAGVALVPLFVLDFLLARKVYGLAAAVHAWLEVPVLLLALGATPTASD